MTANSTRISTQVRQLPRTLLVQISRCGVTRITCISSRYSRVQGVDLLFTGARRGHVIHGCKAWTCHDKFGLELKLVQRTNFDLKLSS